MDAVVLTVTLTGAGISLSIVGLAAWLIVQDERATARPRRRPQPQPLALASANDDGGGPPTEPMRIDAVAEPTTGPQARHRAARATPGRAGTDPAARGATTGGGEA